MPRRTRRLIVSGLVIVVLVIAFKVVAPFLISSSVVRESMERAVAEWTGHDVTIAGTPDIRFWPEPRITLRDITIRRKTDQGERLLGHVARLSAAFDLMEAILGRPEFQDFRMTNPEIHVLREPDGRLDWANDGLLSRAVRGAKADGEGQALAADADARMGDVRISDGIFELTDVASGRVMRFEAVNGTVDWPWLSRGLEIKAQALFNKHQLSIDMDSTQPLLLLSGRNGDAAWTVKSDLFNGHFDGTADLASNAFLSGAAELSVPDLPAVLAWSGISLAGADRLKSLSLSAKLIANDDVLRFDNLSLGLNDSKATGILDLVLPSGRRPRLTGTLAFDRMDLSGILTAIAPRAIGAASPSDSLRAGTELDLRLSAQQARLGPFQLAEAAISIMNTPDQSRVDIADSDFEGGRLTGRISTLRGSETGAIGLRFAVQNADFGNIVKELGLSGPLPAARGTLDVSLDIDRPLTLEAWRNAKGNIRFRADHGLLPGINVAAIRKLATQKPYFPLSEAGNGSFEFNDIDISADLANGSADIRDGKIVGANDTISLSGVIPYASNSLSLSASVKPNVENATTTPLMTFIGGSWPNPVIWPISQSSALP